MRRIVLTTSIVGLAMAAMAPAGASPHATTITAPAAKRATPPVQFATWNFCNSTCGNWDRRLLAFVRTVSATRPDVLAVQELDIRDDHLAKTARALRPLGYVEADPGVYASCSGGCESHLFVRSRTIRVVQGPRAGLQGKSRTAGIVPPGVLPVRGRINPVSFALLEHRATGARVLALSLHLEKQGGTDLNGPDDRARNDTVRALARWSASYAAGLGAPRTPTVMLGDFNSYPRKQPNGPHRVLVKRGYLNTENARTTLGDKYATVNKTPADARRNGFPPRPRVFPLGGPRIDGVLTKGLPTALRYQVYIRTRPDGRFDERYRASDHNLVRTWIALPR